MFAPAPARAYEDQVGLTLGLGYVSTPIGDRPTHGIGGGLVLGWGLDDVFTVRGRLDYSVHPGGEGPTQHRGMLGAELLYLLDVLAWVPYFGAGAAGVAWLVDGDLQPDVGLFLVGGLQYLWQRELIFGLEVRGLAVARAPEDEFAQMLVMLSATYLWEVY